LDLNAALKTVNIYKLSFEALEDNVLRGLTDDCHEMLISNAVAGGSMCSMLCARGSGRGRR